MLPGEGVLVLSETSRTLFRGELYERLVPLLDGRHGLSGLVRALGSTFGAAHVHYGVARLTKVGVMGAVTHKALTHRGDRMDDHADLNDAGPQIHDRIHASFAQKGLMGHLGARLSHVGPGRVHIVLPYRPEVTQQDGYIHAGATSAIADSYAALTRLPERSSEP